MVASFGPPLVRTFGTVLFVKLETVRTMMDRRSCVLMRGSLMCQSICQGEAPSTFAASISVGSRLLRPARIMIIA